MLERVEAARPAHIAAEEWEVRVQLAACYRLVDLQAAVVDLIGPPAKPSEPPQPTA